MSRSWSAPWPAVRTLAAPLARSVDNTPAPCTQEPELFDPEQAKETTGEFELRLRAAVKLCAGCGNVDGCLESATRNRLSGVFAGQLVMRGVVKDRTVSLALDGEHS